MDVVSYPGWMLLRLVPLLLKERTRTMADMGRTPTADRQQRTNLEIHPQNVRYVNVKCVLNRVSQSALLTPLSTKRFLMVKWVAVFKFVKTLRDGSLLVKVLMASQIKDFN